jgi:hypothetical protein
LFCQAPEKAKPKKSRPAGADIGSQAVVSGGRRRLDSSSAAHPNLVPDLVPTSAHLTAPDGTAAEPKPRCRSQVDSRRESSKSGSLRGVWVRFPPSAPDRPASAPSGSPLRRLARATGVAWQRVAVGLLEAAER